MYTEQMKIHIFKIKFLMQHRTPGTQFYSFT